MVLFRIQTYGWQCAVIHPSSCGIYFKWLRASPSLWPFPASLKQDLGGKADLLLVVKILFKFKETDLGAMQWQWEPGPISQSFSIPANLW